MPLPLLLIPIVAAAASSAAATSTGVIVGATIGGAAVGGAGITGFWWYFFRPKARLSKDASSSGVELKSSKEATIPLEFQNPDAYIRRIGTTLKRIEAYYPLVHSSIKRPRDSHEDMEDLAGGLEAAHAVYFSSYKHFESVLTAYINFNAGASGDFSLSDYHASLKELSEAARDFFKYLEDYHLQISSRAGELLGPEAPDCKSEIGAINSYLLTFETSLGKLSEEILKIPGLKSPLFSLGNYLSTLSERCKREDKPSLLCKGIFGANTSNSKWSSHISFIQKISAHYDCTDEIRLSLIEILREKMKDKASLSSSLYEVLRLAISHSFPLEAPFVRDVERISMIFALSSSNVPREFQLFLQVEETEKRAEPRFVI